MTAETLRRAATLMRERAEGASTSPWTTLHSKRFGPQAAFSTGLNTVQLSERFETEGGYRGAQNAEHIASWHPAVALAVADWLEWLADRSESGNDIPAMRGQGLEQALAVARAFLGEEA